jgi:hypothetical protein
MEHLEAIYQVQQKLTARFGSPREAYRELVNGRVTKVKFLVSMFYELEISPYSGAEFLWLFEDMDTVTEAIWAESFSRVSNMYNRALMTPK